VNNGRTDNGSPVLLVAEGDGVSSVELSVVIPVLDEALTLPGLLSDLSAQRKVAFDVLVVDGGSSDNTPTLAEQRLVKLGLSGRVLSSRQGRGFQLNCGASHARGEWLLFLHADSRLPEPCVLRHSLDQLVMRNREGECPVAGHFSLEFDLGGNPENLAYQFYRAKAHSGRSGTIHGDQGFWIRSVDFESVGRFREDLPVMEDSSFAEDFRRVGEWQLLPGRIVTSTRRFKSEGLIERQTLNALMMNFLAIDWLDFVRQAPDLYRRQEQASQLDLLPFFDLIRDLLSQMPVWRRRALWLATGSYVRSQLWQVGLFLDCRRNQSCWLERFDRWLRPLVNHRIGDLISAVLIRVWFAWTKNRLRQKSNRVGSR